MGSGETGIDRQGLPMVTNGLLVATGGMQRVGVVDAHRHMRRLQRQRSLVLQAGLVRTVERQQGVAEIVERANVAGPQREGLFVVTNGFVVAMEALQRDAEMGMRIGKGGVDADRLPE